MSIWISSIHGIICCPFWRLVRAGFDSPFLFESFLKKVLRLFLPAVFCFCSFERKAIGNIQLTR